MSMRTIIQMLKPGLLISITALLATTVQAQQVYKWKDAKGVLHYTQTPPPARHAQSVNIKERPAPAPAANAQKTALASNAATSTVTKAAASLSKPVVKLSAEACQGLQDNLALLQTGRRLYENDTGGERAYMTEQRRAQQIRIYQHNIATGCS